MNMMTFAIEGVDKINTQLPSKPKPLDIRGAARSTPSFEEMLRGARENPQEINDRLNMESKSKSAEASHEESGKTIKAQSEETVQKDEAAGEDTKRLGDDSKGNAARFASAKENNEAAAQKGSVNLAQAKKANAKNGRGVIANGKKECNVKEANASQTKSTAKDENASDAQRNKRGKGVFQKGKDTSAKDSIKESVSKKDDAPDAKENLKDEERFDDAKSNSAAIADIKVQNDNALDKKNNAQAYSTEDIKIDDAHLSTASKDGVAVGKSKGAQAKGALKKKTLDKDEKITVTDLRTAADKAKVNEAEAQKDEKPLSKVYAAKGEVEITINAADTAQANITSSSTQSAGASSSTFQAMVENSVRENTPEIVRAGSLILRNNNTGTINLVMHPENLGNVRIVLHVADNVISGQITVHSEEAYNAFKSNAASLSQAFNDSGFQAQGFTVAYSGGDANPQQGQGQYSPESQFMSEKALRGYDNAAVSVPSSASVAYSNDYSVNVVA